MIPATHTQTYAITGASQGIGRALAIALAARGAHVVLGARNQAALQETQIACQQAGGQHSQGRGGAIRCHPTRFLRSVCQGWRGCLWTVGLFDQ